MGEYNSNEFVKFCKENGILKQCTIPYTPQQNGVVKRKYIVKWDWFDVCIDNLVDISLNPWEKSIFYL